MRTLVLIAATLAVTGALASPRAQQSEADDVEARPIAAPARPLPREEATAGVTRFSFIACGDTRSSGPSRSGEPPEDGRMLQREHGLVVDAMLKTASRRLTGYPTYAFGYGNAFFLLIDSNIAADARQLEWVTGQLEGLNRRRYRHVFAVFHHPPFVSGQHGGDILEPASQDIRAVYLPLFHKHHVRMTITGHDHLLDHFVERYDDGGRTYRMDHIVSGGGGAPTYTYRGEPDLEPYLSGPTSLKPGPLVEDNPHHFLIVRVDGDRLSLEVVGTGPAPFIPYGRQQVDLN